MFGWKSGSGTSVIALREAPTALALTRRVTRKVLTIAKTR